ncbi:induced myeloid leukemia cell differentiation protein Mcl-1b [Scomber japonicus]|uniref:induced myeloid leukemia cell differentiation protein Mcl-1b n=1 Tax=Scomber japonicus TaxID=13676 RepID=UPI002305CB12|nr:induced myeloid leukemia cell differentiation protein Mcl-1b [Scomber japonicus]
MNIVNKAKGTAMASLLFAQNGVVEGSVLRAPTIDSHNGIVSTNITAKQRPTSLVVNPKNRNGYATKTTTLREGSSDIEDGSLPCSPELQSDSDPDVSGCPAEDEALEIDTRQLIKHFLRDYTGLSKPRWSESKPLSTMKRVVEDVLEKHRYAYNGMINKLSLDDRDDDMRFVSAVATSLFADRTTNWGRVASLVAFGAVVCQYLKEKGRENCVELVAEEISMYLLTDQRDWLIKNNAWDGFVEFFRVADPESTVRNTLMAFAGFAGIGATLALLIR